MTIASSLRNLLEDASEQKRFNMGTLSKQVTQALTHTSILRRYPKVVTVLGAQTSSYVFSSLLRASFFIEIVKTPKIETTKMEVRWASRLDTNDPRYASYEDCSQIFEGGMEEIEKAVEDAEKRELLILLSKKHMLAYEIPLDYNHREVTGYIHRPSNMLWLWDDKSFKRTIKLRAFLVNRITNSYAQVFSKAYADKIKVKTYLTDRVLTGEHKTNREKRWEVHPASVHFAFRRTCMEIENQLIYQLCSFEDFPSALKQRLEKEELLMPVEAPFRCPITMDILYNGGGKLDRSMR